ncbi:MAG: ABC transporter substrate-binding protein, partial [Phycisphaerae bacterium]|nr:ABC transporter substrate-binding protein [Phycisphaerae bacterium]MDW8261659.1 ABC transporter substrate-binding protein [Phycisphaerales bacterium]
MPRNLLILVTLAIVIALPFIFRRTPAEGDWRAGDPILVVITPHNEAIRYEFERGFSRWHQTRFGRPVKIDWRNIGGTTEISRYLTSEYSAAVRAWWRQQGRPWPEGASDAVVSDRFPLDQPPPGVSEETWQRQKEVYQAFRQIDHPSQITAKIDLFFGGGEFDHSNAYARGFTVPPWPSEAVPQGLFTADFAGETIDLIPERVSGEVWRRPYLFGNAISTFGIVYNVDRLRDLGVSRPPSRWEDLADPVYFRQLGVADPTKSGSIAKAFEMIVHQKMRDAAVRAGFDDAAIAVHEATIDRYIKSRGRDYRRGEVPPELIPYQAALEAGWEEGIALLQAIGANARYFTDSASKVPIDVSMGDAAVGMAIDFYGRYQAQMSRGPEGQERMVYATVVGGASMSCDPISLLRGAPNRDLAVRFIEFVLSEDGQRLWAYRPGTPGGPEKFALRRLPIRRDFYPSRNPAVQASFERHRPFTSDDLGDPTVDPYELSQKFVYYRRWTGDHFSVMRDLVKAMCLDSGDELRRAWRVAAGDPGALARLRRL